jgi:hypothetical protein
MTEFTWGAIAGIFFFWLGQVTAAYINKRKYHD